MQPPTPKLWHSTCNVQHATLHCGRSHRPYAVIPRSSRGAIDGRRDAAEHDIPQCSHGQRPRPRRPGALMQTHDGCCRVLRVSCCVFKLCVRCTSRGRLLAARYKARGPHALTCTACHSCRTCVLDPEACEPGALLGTSRNKWYSEYSTWGSGWQAALCGRGRTEGARAARGTLRVWSPASAT
jgi:hypothetical protein